MKRYFYGEQISIFLKTNQQEILGFLVESNEFSLELTQRDSWKCQIELLKDVLSGFEGKIYFEYSIPRMGRRIDVVLIIKNVVFVLEFKVGEKEFLISSLDQVYDYALDLKNFHKTSHEPLIAPVLIATKAKIELGVIATTKHNDNILIPIKSNTDLLLDVITSVLKFSEGEIINQDDWASGVYSPTPTIIEAAIALYRGHSVDEISRKDATAKNLKETSDALSRIIIESKVKRQKSICFVTGVPGAGKTLVGLKVAASNF